MRPGQAIVAVLYWLGERANGDKTNERSMRGATASPETGYFRWHSSKVRH
jgi:hypothetical protein